MLRHDLHRSQFTRPRVGVSLAASLREEVSKLRAEVAELRDYIGEVPTMECGITGFEDWQKEREQP